MQPMIDMPEKTRPANYRTNFLQNNGFILVIPRFPDLTFYSTNFVFPSMELPAATASNPFRTIPLAGDTMSYAPLIFNFMVDENCENYHKVADWVQSISYSTDFADYRDYKGKGKKFQVLGEQDVTVMVLNSKNIPIKTFRFVNAIPVGLGGFEMTAQDAGTNYIWSQVTFVYEYFEMSDPL